MAIQIPNPGTGNGATGDNEFVLWSKVKDNFSDKDNAASRLVDTTMRTADTLYTIRNTDAAMNGAKVVLQYQQGGIGATGIGYLKDVRALGTYADREPDVRLIRISGLSAEIDDGKNLNTDTQEGSVKAGGGFVLNLGGYYNMGGASYMGRVVFSGGRMYVQAVTYSEAYKATYGTKWSQWNEFYSTGNTTKDANGFLKAASPIVKVFADKVELNSDARNQNVTYKKNGIGDYTITTVSGLSTDGWYIELPKDMNGNPKVAVTLSEVDGVISLKSYKRIFSMETFTFEPDLDNPLDIPDTRWIDLRLNEIPVEATDDFQPEEVDLDK